MRLLAFPLCAVLLTACAASGPTKFVGPDGTEHHKVRCTGDTSQCFVQASEVCAGAYSVTDSYSNAGGVFADVIPGPVTWYTMMFQCGPSNGRMPSFALRGQQYSPPPVVVTQPTTTDCTTFGNSVTCRTY